MVQKFLKFIHKEISGVHQAAYLLGFFAVCSQLLALVRDKLLAFGFGAGSHLDLYYASFRIPDFLFVTIGSVVSLSILIPFLAAEYEKGETATRAFIDSVFTFFLVAIVGVSAVVYFAAPFLVSIIFPGFDEYSLETVLHLTRVLLLSPILLGISNLFGSLTQSKNRFFMYALSPLLYNLGIILGILFLYPVFGLSGLVYGVLIGALCHAVIQIPTVLHLNLFPRLTLRPKFSIVKDVALVSLPRTVSLSLSSIVIFFLISFASLMPPGSIAIFTLAFNLQSVPLSIFGVSYSMAAFPALARFSALGNKEEFRSHFLVSAQHILFWVVPSAVLIIVLRAQIVRVVLGSGQFDWTDTRLAAATLALFSISLAFQALSLLFVRALYASGSTGKPFYITLVSGVVMVGSAFVFMNLFAHNPTMRFFIESLLRIPDVPGTEVTMLALGFTIGSILEGLCMWLLFKKVCKDFSQPLLASLFRVLSASIILGFATFSALRVFETIFGTNTFLGLFLQGGLSAVFGIMVGIGILALLKSPELEVVATTLRKKFWKTKAVSPTSELAGL